MIVRLFAGMLVLLCAGCAGPTIASRAAVGEANWFVRLDTFAEAGAVADLRFDHPAKLSEAELTALLKRAGITASVIGEPPLFDVVFAEGPIRDYRDTLRGDAETARRFNALLRERGILKGESKYYVSLAHNDEDIAHTKAAWASAIDQLAAERRR